MATLIDERQNEEQADDLDSKSVDHGELQSIKEPEQEPESPEDDLPEKYKGKSLKELARMHQEAERAIGKHGAELGEYRKLFDAQVQAQLAQNATRDEEPEEAPDWFADPDKAFDYKLNNHPKIKEAEEFTKKYQKEEALNRLKQEHPDLTQVIQDPQFIEWVQKSKVRTNLFIQADRNYDYDAATELVGTWKQLQTANQKTVKEDKDTRQEKVKQASTGAARGAQTGTRKKVYRRSDIMRLREKDPERYNELANEILQAYAENRVV